MARTFLIVTWQAGGGVQPALGLGRLLSGRGHDVQMLAPEVHKEQVEAAGCAWIPFPAEAEFDPAAGRAADGQRAYIEETFFGDVLPDALTAAVRCQPPDALVVDALLASTLSTAQALGPPVAALVHTLRSFHGDAGIFGDWGRPQVNERRARLEQHQLADDGDTIFVELQRRSDLELVAMPAEFDARSETVANVVHMGWMPEPPAGDLQLPWNEADPTPLVVVGLSSTYMHQEWLLERILSTLAELPVHVLATTGPELDPNELRVPASVELRDYVPHSLVLPRASLVVTHAGIGTLMGAFAHGVPCVCVPLGRDQPGNAARAADLGAAIALSPDADGETIRAAVEDALQSDALRAGAERLRDAIAHYADGERGAAALEQLTV
ncbi:MAG: nucleotide disphospho-sugar-binding domain-containing protein [Gaiellaceae bacterium]